MANATACPHTTRPMKARGLCKSCWSKEQRPSWTKPRIVADPSTPASVSRKVRVPADAAPRRTKAAATSAPLAVAQAIIATAVADGIIGPGSAATTAAPSVCPVCGKVGSKSNASRHAKGHAA